MKVWILKAENDGDIMISLGATKEAARQDYIATCLEIYQEEGHEDVTGWGFEEWLEFTEDNIDEWEQEVAQ